MMCTKYITRVLFWCVLASVGLLGCGSGNNHSSNAFPAIVSISPPSATAGSSGENITVSGLNFDSFSVVQWNGNRVTTSYVNSTTLTAHVPAVLLTSVGQYFVNVAESYPGGPSSENRVFNVNAPLAPGETIVSVVANDLAWDPVHQVIYLSLTSAVGATTSTVQVLNPATGQLGTSVSTGSGANLLAISRSSKYLYVGLDGAPNVQRMTLPNLAMDITISLGSDPNLSGPYPFYFAMDLQAGPTSDGTVAIVRGEHTMSPQEEGGVVIYDDGIARPKALCGWIQTGCPNFIPFKLYDSIQWNSDGSEMFAANYESTGSDFYTIPVMDGGFGSATVYPELASGSGNKIHYDAITHYVYDDDGSVIDPIEGTKLGTFAASGLMVPDGSLGKVFFLGQLSGDLGSSDYTLESFDIYTLAPIATMKITNVTATPTHLIRWGTNGLAFTTYIQDQASAAPVYVISNSFVDGSGSSSKTEPVPTQNVRRTWGQPTLY